MRSMSPEEIRRFLLDTPRTAKFATVRADGRPHIAPIWFDLEGEDLIFTTWHTSVKARNLAHDPRATLCVDDEKPPYAYVILEGTVELLNVTSEERVAWATRIARRYMGDALAETFGRRNGVEGEHIARLSVTKIVAHQGITD